MLSLLILLVPVDLASAQTGGLNYCTQGPKDTVIVKSEYLGLTPDLKKSIDEIKASLKALSEEISPYRERILVDGGSYAQLSGGGLDKYIQRATDIRGRVNSLLLQLPHSYRQVGQAVTLAYFNVAALLVELETFTRPEQVGLEALKNKYSLDFTPAAVERFLDPAEFKSQGTEIKARTTDGKLKYVLSLSTETVYNSLVRGAARSPSIPNISKSYLETVRCILSRGILSKLAYNKAISSRGDFGELVTSKDKTCLETNPFETAALVTKEIDSVKDQLIKVRARDVMPAMAKNLDRATIVFMAEAGIIGSMPPLFAQPQLLSVINLKRRELGIPLVDQEQFNLALKSISKTIEAEYLKYPAVEKLRLIWHNPSVQARLASILSNCRFQLKDGSGKALSIEDYVEQLTRGDDYLFLASLYREITNTPGDWANMEPEQLKLEIKNFVLARKTYASLYSLSYLLDALSNATSADSDLLMAAATQEMSVYLRQLFEKIWEKSPDLIKWQNDLAQKILEKRTETLAYDVQLKAFTLTLIKDAKQVQEIMNPAKSISQLDYSEDALLLSLSGLIKSMSADNQRRFRLIRDESDLKKRAEIWREIKSKVEAETKIAGAACEKSGWITGSQQVILGWFGRDSSKQQLAANRDCLSLKMVTGAMAVESQSSPKTMAQSVSFLQDYMELEEFNQEYRKYLAAEILAENRILDIPLDKDGKRKFWERVVEVADADALKDEVLSKLELSISSLESSLKMVTQARKVEDLEFLIKRSGVINSVLGEKRIGKAVGQLSPESGPNNTSLALANDELGFVFPSLVKYHNQLQDRLLLFEDYDRDVWNELFNAQYKVLRIVIAGWLVKWGFSKLPTMTGLPTLGSWVGQKGWLLKDAIGGHADFTFWVMLASLGLIERDLNDYNTELKNIGTLWISEGAGIETPSGLFPLISRNSYIQQELYFKNAIAHAESEKVQTMAWMAVPLILGQGPKVFDASIKALRLRKEAKLGGSGYLGQLKAEASLKSSIDKRIKSVLADLVALGSPKSIDVGSLRAGLDQAIKSAKTSYQVRAANQAYERVITSFGRDLQGYADLPLLQQAYAQALYGGRGSVRQLEELVEEFIRLGGRVKAER